LFARTFSGCNTRGDGQERLFKNNIRRVPSESSDRVEGGKATHTHLPKQLRLEVQRSFCETHEREVGKGNNRLIHILPLGRGLGVYFTRERKVVYFYTCGGGTRV